MPASTMAVLMLVAAVWMVQSPEWWIRLFQDCTEEMEAIERAFWQRWQRPWIAAPSSRLRNDRRTLAGVRLTGILLGMVAAAHLYESVSRMLAH